MNQQTIEIPIEFKRLFDDDWREAAVYGGRFSLKSHTVARFLLIKAREKKRRIGCFREFQNSIADSSHQLLTELINKYELYDFKITDNSIVNTLNGSDFIFKGLHHNEQSIKSIEGIDIAWVEEAQTISKQSLELLTPTVRKEKSQIIYTYNRFLEDDPVHQRLIIEGRPNTLKLNVNYDVALKYGYMPDVVRREMEDDRDNRPALYKHKWMGEPNSLERKIYKDWLEIDEIPHEARLERYGLDYGYSQDPTAIVAIYSYNGGYILDEITYMKGLQNNQIANILKNQDQALVIADSSEPKSIDEILSYGIMILPSKKGQGSVNQGIDYVQQQRISFTRRSQNIAREYRNYVWKIDKDDKIINTPDVGFDHACFVAGTIVNGKKIEEIGVKTGTKRVYEYLIAGEKLTSTKDHKVVTNRGLVDIDTLRYNDVIWKKKLLFMQVSGGIDTQTVKDGLLGTTIVAIKRMLEARGRDYTGLFGKKKMEMFQMDFMFITLMAIPSIMQLAILGLLTAINTFLHIGLKKSENGLKKILKILSVWRQSGLKQKKDINSGSRWVKKIVNIFQGTKSKETVICVGKNILPKQNLVGSATSTVVKKRYAGLVPVYNLKTKSGMYRANGILVSNCDAIRYALTDLKPTEETGSYPDTSFIQGTYY